MRRGSEPVGPRGGRRKGARRQPDESRNAVPANRGRRVAGYVRRGSTPGAWKCPCLPSRGGSVGESYACLERQAPWTGWGRAGWWQGNRKSRRRKAAVLSARNGKEGRQQVCGGRTRRTQGDGHDGALQWGRVQSPLLDWRNRRLVPGKIRRAARRRVGVRQRAYRPARCRFFGPWPAVPPHAFPWRFSWPIRPR